MIQLTDEMVAALSTAFADASPCLVATASGTGKPDVSIKGSLMTWGGDGLAFWERSHGTTLANLAENPQVMVFFRNAARRLSWRFSGRASIYREGTLRQDIMDRTIEAELARDPDRKGVAVVIEIDEIIQGPAVIQRRSEG